MNKKGQIKINYIVQWDNAFHLQHMKIKYVYADSDLKACMSTLGIHIHDLVADT